MRSIKRFWPLLLAFVLGTGLAVTQAAEVAGSAGSSMVRASVSASRLQGVSLDPACNRRRPLQITQSGLGTSNTIGATTLATTLRNNVTLVGASTTSGPFDMLILHALRPDCAPDRAYGSNGVVRLRLPVAKGATYEFIDSVTAAQHGEALIAGSNGGAWLIGRLTANGHLDPSFGVRGWTTIVPPGYVTPGSLYPAASAIALEPSGTIIVGGDNGQAHCCVESYVYALNQAGQIDSGYGGGRPVNVFGQGAYIDQLLAQADNAVLVKGSIVYGGCGGIHLTVLDASGDPATFQQNFDLAHIKPTQFFAGEVFDRSSGGVGVVGYGETMCDQDNFRQFGVIEAFGSSGALDEQYGKRGQAFFDVTNYPDVIGAVPLDSGDVVTVMSIAGEEAPPSNSAILQVRRFSPNGGVDHRFGNNGTEEIHLSSKSETYAFPSALTIAGPNQTVLLVVPTTRDLEVWVLSG